VLAVPVSKKEFSLGGGMFTTRSVHRGANRGVTLGILMWAGLTSLAAAQSAEPPKLAGVWRIARPTTELTPASGSLPFSAEGRKQYTNNMKLKAQRKYVDYDVTRSSCSTPGVPRLMLTPLRFRIWNQLGVVTIDYEWNRAIRQIDLRGGRPQQLIVPDMAGTSVGHWEGDTLVAVTSDFTGRALWDDLMPQSTGAKVTERIRLVDPDTLEDRITAEDPVYFTRPLEAVLTYKRQSDALFPEDVCLDRIHAGEPALPD
jgi:hypothetical protein